MDEFSQLSDVYPDTRDFMLDTAEQVDVGEWHNMDVKGVDALISYEVRDFVWRAPMPQNQLELARTLKANLPWAEDQFHERVSGTPLNPPPSYLDWPWQSTMAHHRICINCKEPIIAHDESGPCQNFREAPFSHSYPERLWPKFAQENGWPFITPPHGEPVRRGIRYAYGDLFDVVELLKRSPFTRQAYVPMFFPEDTGNHANQRVPCTLGYHLLRRQDRLHLSYFIRSCDLRRHFVDDVYMAIRLAQWFRNQLHLRDSAWRRVEMGDFTFHCTSMHYFEGDRKALEGERQMNHTQAESEWGAAI